MTHIYRPGDQVEIVNPRWIKRVGYALHWQDFMEEVKNDPRTAEALKALGFTGRDAPLYFMQAVAKLHVEQRRFGGNERAIRYMKMAEPGAGFSLDLLDTMPHHGYVGRVAIVEGKRVAYTGTRFPPSSGGSWTADGYEDWYEPGGLENRKAHVILKITYGEIEACDVKLIKAATP